MRDLAESASRMRRPRPVRRLWRWNASLQLARQLGVSSGPGHDRANKGGGEAIAVDDVRRKIRFCYPRRMTSSHIIQKYDADQLANITSSSHVLEGLKARSSARFIQCPVPGCRMRLQRSTCSGDRDLSIDHSRAC